MPQVENPRTVATANYRSLSDPATLAQFALNLEEGIYITTATGEILDANPAFLRIFGMPSLDALKKYRVSDFIDSKIREREIALLERDGSSRNRELQITRTDGDVRTVLDTWYRCEDPATGETVFHGILVDITERKRLETRLVEQSVRDPLTGCYNRRFFQNLLERLRDSNDRWGCIYADIDHFKRVNDLEGHAAGDAVLVKMSRFLMRHVRAEEPVVRMGGDEFLIVLSNVTDEHTRNIARRIEAAAHDSAPTSFTLGWAARTPGERLEDTVHRADEALIAVRVEKRPPWPQQRIPSG